MPYINQIRILSFYVFFLPILAINISLYISVNWWQICNDLIPFITTDEICKNTVGSAIGYTFPYFDGEVSISRTGRVFPSYWIFKPLMITTALLLMKYWMDNFNLMNQINSENKIKFYFRFFGLSSAVFLIIHSIFLGIKLDFEFYRIFRKFIVLSFIIFELVAQVLLVLNLYKFKNLIKNLFIHLVLKLKILLVISLSLIATLSVPILISSGNREIKHLLEWNFFTAVCFFYLLTYFFWKKNKTSVHTPEGV